MSTTRNALLIIGLTESKFDALSEQDKFTDLIDMLPVEHIPSNFNSDESYMGIILGDTHYDSIEFSIEELNEYWNKYINMFEDAGIEKRFVKFHLIYQAY